MPVGNTMAFLPTGDQMVKPHRACPFLLAGLVLGSSGSPNSACAENWPCWRGPRGDGTSLEKEPPTRWSSTENVVWKTPVPGEGQSSPIIWDNRIFLTSALKESQERVLLSFDRKTGAMIWQQAVVRSPLEAKNKEN